jgi:hypothetical protein
MNVPRSVLIVALACLGIGLAARPTAAATVSCSVTSTVLGQLPTFTGSTPTDWFNVFGEGLDPGGAWSVAFSVPVMGWPIPPLTYDPAKPQTMIAVPSNPSGGLKWTVRTRDLGVNSLTIHVSDGRCTASHVVVLVPNTSTQPDPPGEPFPILVALAGGALGAFLVLARPTGRGLGPRAVR